MKTKEKLNKIKQRLDKLSASKGFQKRVAEIRASLHIPQSGCKTFEEVNLKILDSFGNNLICSIGKEKQELNNINFIQAMLEDFEIPLFYKEFIESYVYYNDFYANSVNKEIADSSVKVKVFIKGNDGNFYTDDYSKFDYSSKIYLEINTETTIKDVQAVWRSEVKELQKRLIGYKPRHKFSSPKNFEINKRMVYLHDQGFATEDIKTIIKKEFDKTLNYDVINKRISEFKAKNQ